MAECWAVLQAGEVIDHRDGMSFKCAVATTTAIQKRAGSA
jgi:hypothetical protein